MGGQDEYYQDDLFNDDNADNGQQQQQQYDDWAAANNGNAAYEGEQKWCKVYDKDDSFTVLVQAALAFAALLSLYWKRMHETPRRTMKTWSLDVSKQGFGACYAHVLNMMIAAIISNNIRGDTDLKDQCAWYGLSYLIDTTLGLVLSVWLLQAQTAAANKYHWEALKYSGVYTGPDALYHWFVQCSSWLINLTIVKIIIYFFMWTFSDWLAFVGGLLFKPFQSNTRFELLFVMIFFPGVLNVIYFWIADHYLKADKDHAGAHETPSLDSKKEHLMASEQPIEAIPVRKQPGLAHAAEASQPAWTSIGSQQNVATATPNQVFPAKDDAQNNSSSAV